MHETNQGEAERDLSSTIDSVNSAFDDSEKVLVIKLEEYLCEKIKEAFPETFLLAREPALSLHCLNLFSDL